MNKHGLFQGVNSLSTKSYFHCPENYAYSYNDRFFIATFTYDPDSTSVTEIQGKTIAEMISEYPTITCEINANTGATVSFDSSTGLFSDYVYHSYYPVSVNVVNNYAQAITDTGYKQIGMSAMTFTDTTQGTEPVTSDVCTDQLSFDPSKLYHGDRHGYYYKKLLPLDSINSLKFWFYLSPVKQQFLTIVIQTEL